MLSICLELCPCYGPLRGTGAAASLNRRPKLKDIA